MSVLVVTLLALVEIRIYEDTDNGTHYTGFKAGNNTASVAYVLPTADGSSGHALQTDGSGTLSGVPLVQSPLTVIQLIIEL